MSVFTIFRVYFRAVCTESYDIHNCTSYPFSRIWSHNIFLKPKLSKSVGYSSCDIDSFSLYGLCQLSRLNTSFVANRVYFYHFLCPLSWLTVYFFAHGSMCISHLKISPVWPNSSWIGCKDVILQQLKECERTSVYMSALSFTVHVCCHHWIECLYQLHSHVATCTRVVLLVNSFPWGHSIHKHDMYTVYTDIIMYVTWQHILQSCTAAYLA